MTPVETVLELCKERGVKVSKLEKDCGFSNAYIKGLKNGKISAERVRIIADYFNVPYHKIDPEIFPEMQEGYYVNTEASRVAQEIFDNPDLRLLFEAARDVKPENIRLAAEMLRRFKETNTDG